MADNGKRPQVDWGIAAATGRRLAGNGPAVTDYTRDRAREQLLAFAAEAEGHVRAVTGLATGAEIPAARVVDRREWVDAACRSMSALLDGDDPGRPGLGARVAGLQAGGVFGFVSGSILGQYDPFATEPGEQSTAERGRLLLVAPNVVHVERALNLNPDDFRMWVCLHEVTHRVQFAANPWLREYMRSNVAALTGEGSEGSLGELVERVSRALAGQQRHSGVIGLLQIAAPAKQFAAVENLLMLGTLLEGHADHVMDAAGPTVVPTVAAIRAAFDRRRSAPSNPLQKLLRALLGVDAKIEQYVRGKRFVDAVVAQVGMERFNTVWSGPETLPLPDELDDPARWVARVLPPPGP